MKLPYRPINCLYYDRLEAWATLEEDCTIIWMGEDKLNHQVQSKILDLVIQDKAEYLIGEKGLQIRLDLLVSINGIPLIEGYCDTKMDR